MNERLGGVTFGSERDHRRRGGPHLVQRHGGRGGVRVLTAERAGRIERALNAAAPLRSQGNPPAPRASSAVRSRTSIRNGTSRGRHTPAGAPASDSRRSRSARAAAADASPRIARAKSYQLASPEDERWYNPARSAIAGNPAATMRTVADASVRLQLGTPIWSATTVSSSRSAASLRIVSRKFLPRKPYTQLVRSTIACAPASAIARSPSSLLSSVDVQRRRRRVLRIRCRPRSVEHVVGGKMNEHRRERASPLPRECPGRAR